MTSAHPPVSRDNNLQLVRLICASMVWVSHSFPLGYGDEPIVGLGYNVGSYGTLGVFGFFTISGYLISQSYLRLDSLERFLWNRFLRIAPALWMSVLLGALLAYLTTKGIGLKQFFTDSSVRGYLFGNATLLDIKRNAVNWAFSDNRFNVINGPLWTLPVEVRMYLFVATLGVLGILRAHLFSVMLVILAFCDIRVLYNFILLGVAEPGELQASLPVLYFFMGMFFGLNNTPLKTSWFLVAAAGAITAFYVPIFVTPQVIFTAYAFYFLSFRLNLGRKFFNSIGDYSYGIYVYAFPIQQFSCFALLHYFGMRATPALVMLVSGPAILLVSVLSWHFLESKMLTLKNLRLGAMLRAIPVLGPVLGPAAATNSTK